MQGRSKRKLFLLVTADEYELPVFVADSREEMAEYLGIKPYLVTVNIKRGNLREDKYKIVAVTIPKEDMDGDEDW